MKIGIVVNDVDTEVPAAATTVIAHAAVTLGHTVRMISVGDLTYYADGGVGGIARKSPGKRTQSTATFLKAVQGKAAEREAILTDDLDVLWLRYNPAEAVGDKAWQRDAGIVFGQIAMRRGVLVLNHPTTLSYAINKMYFQHFPEAVRPKTIITRSREEILKFHDANGGHTVLKPLFGYGGTDVYLLEEDVTNLNQIVESISRSSYVIAQEYLPAATEGDIRLFMMNGKPLMCDGKYAAVRRVNRSDDFRSNMTAGAKPTKAKIDDRILELAELVRPKLLQDGLFFVGIDIVGDKLVEINTISAGGLNIAGKMEGVNFGVEVVRAIERKVFYKRHYGDTLSNLELAVLD